MTIDEFITRVADQPPITVEHRVSVSTGQNVRTAPISLAEVVANSQFQIRAFAYGHVLGTGLSRDTIQRWQESHALHPLPNDLIELLTRANGVHLWADLASGRAYFGILPLDEWQDVGAAGWAIMFAQPPSGNLVMSYHANGDEFLVLDTATSLYRWCDLGNFGEPKQIGGTVEDLLGFWWHLIAWLDPRRG